MCVFVGEGEKWEHFQRRAVTKAPGAEDCAVCSAQCAGRMCRQSSSCPGDSVSQPYLGRRLVQFDSPAGNNPKQRPAATDCLHTHAHTQADRVSLCLLLAHKLLYPQLATAADKKEATKHLCMV